MSRNTEEFSEYGAAPGEHDYSNPAYYRQSVPQTPRSAQPVQHLDSYLDDGNDPTRVDDYDTAQMSAYRGPSSLESYTTDVGAEQREAARRGSASGSRKRKGLAGLGGI